MQHNRFLLPDFLIECFTENNNREKMKEVSNKNI